MLRASIMRLLKDLGTLIEAIVAPLITGTLLLASAVTLLVFYARPACACNPKYKAYLTAMKSDMRNMVVAQEAHQAKHGAYALELPADEYRHSTGVTIVSMDVRRTGFSVEMAYPAGTTRRCRLVYVQGRPWAPSCDP
jgi:hypothetical protein